LEIKRDYEYLIKTWVQIRDKTMESSAPTLIHEEGNLIKRALRDMYTRDISEVLIEGDAEYRTAKDFMKILTPSHAKKIKQYKDDTMPLFFRYQVESQLEALHSNIVQLKSGAYLVMDQTEALVAIDVNSGRATKERNIEETALKTNLEAADEIARQLRLRDMAGLVVIDFIDMEESRNNHAVERRMKEALKRDRARVQMGRITGFGLMELSRQRLHSSFIETSYSPCPYCKGKGMMRSTESVSIHTLHVLEEESLKRRFSELHMTVPTPTALYVLNKKREDLHKIEMAYNVRIFLETDDSLLFPTDYRIERVVRVEADSITDPGSEEENEIAEEQEETPVVQAVKQPRERRRRRNRRDQKEHKNADTESVKNVQAESTVESEEEIIQADEMFEEGLKSSQKAEEQTEEPQEKSKEMKHHRRGRFLRRNKRFHKNKASAEASENSFEETNASDQQVAQENEEKPVRKPRRRYNRRRHNTPAPAETAE
jgi:ribonuclease E